MQSIYAYNLITILNCARAKFLAHKNHNLSSLYNVPFHVLDDLEIEDVIKVIGLYPIPFFSLKASHSIQKSEEISAIRNIWRGIHLLDHSHALTLNSKTKEMSDIHESFILTNNYWSILESKHPDPISTILFSLKKIGRADNSNNLPPPDTKPYLQALIEF